MEACKFFYHSLSLQPDIPVSWAAETILTLLRPIEDAAGYDCLVIRQLDALPRLRSAPMWLLLLHIYLTLRTRPTKPGMSTCQHVTIFRRHPNRPCNSFTSGSHNIGLRNAKSDSKDNLEPMLLLPFQWLVRRLRLRIERTDNPYP